MDAREIAFRERFRPEPVTPAVVATPAPEISEQSDPTEGLPLFVNVGNATSDAAIERLFAQEGG